MPRSLLEFPRAMPDIAIVPNPVFPEISRERWWLRPRRELLVAGEYDKYLVALVRPLVPVALHAVGRRR